MTIQERALRYVSKINAISGSGVHKSTFQVAAILRNGFALSVDDSLAIMEQWNQTNADPPWTEHQLRHKVLSVDISAGQNPRGNLLNHAERADLGISKDEAHLPQKRRRGWPKCDPDRVIHLLKNELVTREDFNRTSPVKPNEIGGSNEIIDLLFCQGETKNPWLCIGKDLYHGQTKLREDWRSRLDSETFEFIVPNYMNGPSGETLTGELSPRAKTNVMERRFIVIECDFDQEKHPEIFAELDRQNLSVQDLCSTVLTHLGKTAPLVMAVNSGGKSIHGWIPVLAASRRMKIKFFREACALGADPQMFNTNQWTRFPGGIRSGNRETQTVEYFNPDRWLLNFDLV